MRYNFLLYADLKEHWFRQFKYDLSTPEPQTGERDYL